MPTFSKTISFVFFTLFAFTLVGQPCNCREALLFVQSKIESNYSGFQDKINAVNRSAYDDHCKKYLKSASQIKDPHQCAQHMRQWSGIFNEGNIRIENVRPELENWSDEQVMAYFSNTRILPKWNEARIKQYLDTKATDPIEGIWENKVKTYVTAIIKSPTSKSENAYVGIVLKADGVYWREGMVKMDLKKKEDGFEVDFYLRDHDVMKLDGVLLSESVLELTGLTQWMKVYPATNEASRQAFDPDYYQKMFAPKPQTCKKLSAETTLLTLPSFKVEHASSIDSLVSTNKEMITETDNLIIDLRGNDGGSDLAFAPLIPLIYSHPIYVEGVSVLASEDNIKSWEVLLENPRISQEIKLRIAELVAKMKLNVGKFIEVPGETNRLEAAMPYPKHVGIIVDKKCSGSTEQFILLAKQSDKVTVFGTATAGMIDYLHMRSAQIPGLPYRVRYATSKSNRLPHKSYNTTGVVPHVLLEDGDWIEIVNMHLTSLAEK